MADEQPSTVPPELLERLSGLLPTTAWTSTVPIMVMVDDSLTPHATGTLLRIADASFMVTAAHVLTSAKEIGTNILVGTPGHDHPLQIAGHAFKAVDDELDVAIWRLSDDSVRNLSNNTFLRLTDILIQDGFSEDFYFVCGFPCEHSTSAASADQFAKVAPLQFCTHLFDGNPKDAPGYNPKYHVLLSAGREYLTRGRGADRDFPEKVFGLSGCGIWKSNALETDKSRWKDGQAKLAAVQTCAYPRGRAHKILRGTTWKAVGSLIVAVYPELKPSFSIAYG